MQHNPRRVMMAVCYPDPATQGHEGEPALDTGALHRAAERARNGAGWPVLYQHVPPSEYWARPGESVESALARLHAAFKKRMIGRAIGVSRDKKGRVLFAAEFSPSRDGVFRAVDRRHVGSVSTTAVRDAARNTHLAETSLVKTPRLPGTHVTWTGYVDDAELARMARKAEMALTPSRRSLDEPGLDEIRPLVLTHGTAGVSANSAEYATLPPTNTFFTVDMSDTPSSASRFDKMLDADLTEMTKREAQAEPEKAEPEPEKAEAGEKRAREDDSPALQRAEAEARDASAEASSSSQQTNFMEMMIAMQKQQAEQHRQMMEAVFSKKAKPAEGDSDKSVERLYEQYNELKRNMDQMATRNAPKAEPPIENDLTLTETLKLFPQLKGEILNMKLASRAVGNYNKARPRGAPPMRPSIGERFLDQNDSAEARLQKLAAFKSLMNVGAAPYAEEPFGEFSDYFMEEARNRLKHAGVAANGVGGFSEEEIHRFDTMAVSENFDVLDRVMFDAPANAPTA